MVVHIASAKMTECEGASHHTAFMGKESGGRGSLRFPCVTLSGGNLLRQSHI